jgi:uncharacterized membrane protein
MFDTTHLHPMLVHFPIALAMAGALLEAVRFLFSKSETKLPCGELLLYFAAASAVFALLSGFLFTASFSGKPIEVRNLHVLLASLTTASLLMASFFYLLNRFGKQKRKITYLTGLAFYMLSALLVGATGFMGGNLVYTYMIGL